MRVPLSVGSTNHTPPPMMVSSIGHSLTQMPFLWYEIFPLILWRVTFFLGASHSTRLSGFFSPVTDPPPSPTNGGRYFTEGSGSFSAEDGTRVFGNLSVLDLYLGAVFFFSPDVIWLLALTSNRADKFGRNLPSLLQSLSGVSSTADLNIVGRLLCGGRWARG